MRLSSVILIITILFGFSGCYVGPHTYEIFEQHRNYFVKEKYSMNVFYGIKKEFNDSEYVYIQAPRPDSPNNIPKECVYGYITKKDDPNQAAIRWEIISGHEHCKAQIRYSSLI